MREEAAVAAAAEAAAAGGDVKAVAAAAVAAAAAAAEREGFGRSSGPRARRRQQPRPHPPRKPGQLRVKGYHRGGGGDNGCDDADVDEDAGTTVAVAAGGQRVRLTTNDFQTPVRRPRPGTFTAGAAAAAATAARQGGDCQLCALGGAAANGGHVMTLPATAGTGKCGCKPTEILSQTNEMEFCPPPTTASGGRGAAAAAGAARGFLRANARPGGAEEKTTSFGSLGDEVKEQEPEVRPPRCVNEPLLHLLYLMSNARF